MAPEDRRKAIIDAVVPLLAAHGPAVTTRQIAEAAGVAEGTIFRVFPDKRSLLMATAAETVNPSGGAAAMAAALAKVPELRAKVELVVEQMLSRMQQGMLVLVALRHAVLKEGHDLAGDQPPGPPSFILDANRALLEALITTVFAPHSEELRVPPELAALILRSLVFGAWHPGTTDESRLTTEQIADACLGGVAKGDH